MFQKIVESKKIGNFFFHTLENGALISCAEINLLDEELKDGQEVDFHLRNFLKYVPQGRTLRVYLKSEYLLESPSDHSREKAISSTGFVENKAYLCLEKHPFIDLNKLFKKNLSEDSLVADIDFFSLNGLNSKTLGIKEINNIFPKIEDELYHSFRHIDLGNCFVGILRLTKQSELGTSLTTLSHVKDSLPLPYLICCSIQPLNQAESETFLMRRSKQNQNPGNIKEDRKLQEAQIDLEDITLKGAKLFRFEWQCLVFRNKGDIFSLRKDLQEVKQKLQPLGDIYIESVGAFESLKSFYPGGLPHVSLLEKDSSLVTYLPLSSRGDSKNPPLRKRSLVLQRSDESLTYLDILDPRYEAYSWCIFGRSGRGKSVLTNAITRALVNDPDVKVIKVDVGSSHSRETQMLGGVEKTLNISQPTGINPFNIINDLGPTKESTQILSAFLEVLVLEEGETKLTKLIKSDLERAVSLYYEKTRKSFSLNDFYEKLSEGDLPRKNLLRRWVGSGVYGNAFAVQDSAQGSDTDSNHLIYYNFANISQASDPDYAQGGFASVMVQFNIDMLKKTDRKKRLIFIADETPFFIKKCFSFFNLSIANIRKEGHGFITIAQKSAHVVVNGDTGILDNSPSRVYFSSDGDDQEFLERNHISQVGFDKIQNLIHGNFSEFLLKDILGERVVRLRLSREEYWSYTSKNEDRQRFDSIQKAFPLLKTEDIIKCLSIVE